MLLTEKLFQDRNQSVKLFIGLAFSLLLYLTIVYFTPRERFIQLISIYSALFALYVWIYQLIKEHHYRLCIFFSIAARILVVFTPPNLSDDFYRFIWDGQLLTYGISPFAEIPSAIYDKEHVMKGFSEELFLNLNSPEFYSVYPPLCQFIFWISQTLFRENIYGSVVLMKFILALFDVGTIFLLSKLTVILGVRFKRIFIYALNPLVIIELSGNCHFESAMIFFLILFLVSITEQQTFSPDQQETTINEGSAQLKLKSRSKPVESYFRIFEYNNASISFLKAALSFSLAVCSKLLPCIFFPILFRRYGYKQTLLFSIAVLAVCTLFFLPFVDTKTINHILQSLSLYFQKFEFNASIYYLLREVGYLVWNFNMISVIGKTLFIGTIIGVMIIAITDNKRSLVESMFFTIAIYLALATSVHSWYVTTLVVLSVFVNWRFGVVWSGFVMLSYAAYSTYPYKENLWIVLIEYAAVYGFAGWELIKFYRKVS